jgi:BolA family transcriptional regulator, general stress-responsive regulator
MTEREHPVADRIRRSLETALAPTRLDVVDESHKHAGHAHVMTRPGTAGAPGETHFRIKVVAEEFAGKSRLERHRRINALIADEMGPNKVHALAIEARAPGE